MDLGVLRRMRRRFVSMAGDSAIRVGAQREHIDLKRDHSLRVHALASRIVAREGLAPVTLHLAAALLHDVGRFPQYERFRTYRDDESVDHGEEGARFLRESGFLADFSTLERDAVIEAVRLHNKRELPAGMDPLVRSLCVTVRDADKLDIVPVVLSRMMPGGPRDGIITLGLDDDPGAWTESVAEAVAAGESPAYTDMRYVNDFKLLLASWGPMLVHGASRDIYAGRGYLDTLFSLLPQTARFAKLREGLAGRLMR